MIWAIIMALYMLITSALIANLYTRYCEENKCREDVEAKFIIFPVVGFIILAIWVSSVSQIYDHTHTLNFCYAYEQATWRKRL